MTWTIGRQLLLGLGAICLGLWLFLLALGDAHQQGYAKAKAEGELALEQLRGTHLTLDLARAQVAADSAKQGAKKLQDEQARNDRLASDLAELQRTLRKTTDRLTGEIDRVNDLYRDALDAQPKPLPACVFTAGWVRLYDEATGAVAAGMPSTADTSRTAAQVAEGRAAEQLNSGISQRDVLAHHVRYAEQCRSTAEQLDALIDAVEGQ